MFGFKRRRRRRLRETPLSPEWLAILDRNIPYYRVLSPEDRRELEGHIQVFLAEKRFEGLGGLTITDEIRVSIAALACVLLLHRETDYYPKVTSILVYPSAFSVQTKRRQPDGTVANVDEVHLGEAWHWGEVILSWDDVRKGAADIRDGQNVVFHEFAHKLDAEDGPTDGAPALERRSMYVAWARVLSGEYEHLIDDLEHHRRTCLRSYAATNPAEFFAVVTEEFFERPTRLLTCHPALYEQMKLYFRQDPAERSMAPVKR